MTWPLSCAKQVLRADLTWTGTRFERDITIAIGTHGRIEYIGSAPPPKYALATRLTSRALLPGMINSHSHAFQRGLRGLGETYPPDATSSFWTWREEMYKLVGRLSRDEFYKLTRQCFDEMRSSGITTCGEFHYFHHLQGSTAYELDDVVLEAARDAGIRLVLLNAFYQRGGMKDEQLNESQLRFSTGTVQGFWENMQALKAKVEALSCSPLCPSLGVVAHSVRAVNIKDIVALKKLSDEAKYPFHMHVEEQMAEIEACKSAHGITPMRLLLDHDTVDDKFTAVHATFTCEEDMKDFIERGGRVCMCPLTEGALGDGLAKVTEMKGRVAIGTDCNARICMLEEMRWLEYGQRLKMGRRGVLGQDVALELFKTVSSTGAECLRVEAGRLDTGLWADMITVDLQHPLLSGWKEESLMASIIFGCSSEAVVVSSCVGGMWKDIRAITSVASSGVSAQPLLADGKRGCESATSAQNKKPKVDSVGYNDT